jgi:hypothetical protein
VQIFLVYAVVPKPNNNQISAVLPADNIYSRSIFPAQVEMARAIIQPENLLHVRQAHSFLNPVKVRLRNPAPAGAD